MKTIRNLEARCRISEQGEIEMPKVGRPKGSRKTGGRKKGTPNKSTKEMKELAQEYGPTVIKKLAKIVQRSKNEMAVISAGKELLEHGYGKVNQPFTGEDDGSIHVTHHADADTLALLRQIAGIGPDSELPPASA